MSKIKWKIAYVSNILEAKGNISPPGA